MHGNQPSLAPQLAMKTIQQQRPARARSRPAPARGAEEEASSEQRKEPSATCARVGSSRCRNHMQSSKHGEFERDLPFSRCSSRSSLSKQSSEGRDQATATIDAAIRRKWRSSGEEERARGSAVQVAFKLLQG
ncbi:hypothetical protein ACOSQ2_007427 [Xanthoceras sorbifolium]